MTVLTIRPGEPLPTRTFGPVTRTDIVRYAGASGDFNPIHHDEGFATAAGFPTVFSIGMYQAGLLATYVTDLLGPENVRRFSVQFREQVWPGDELSCSGTITEADDGGAGRWRVALDIECRRSGGGVAIRGSAEFVIPSAGEGAGR
ncbi:MaoC/PaaZ C-terminal domain-containing protein [Microtetraspora sp. NBRC 16547]|uniref:MaoC/PaaZ C-terminal domain-containing protein n=1 Tax=Microtetraspora sp. NBRC 16547 TaxID=3030993 RepID=UPI0024A45009|nr:MaoC/PaaZ C-terminal domain-containing protein [Microtetraspora sp. NBRC 16547]GLW99317.1 MaoC-like dehydratase [Microtetraspora sp. NBRC 16547]